MDRLLTYMEAAAKIGVSYARVSQFVSQGRLPVESFGENGASKRIRESAVDKFMEARAVPDALPLIEHQEVAT